MLTLTPVTIMYSALDDLWFKDKKIKNKLIVYLFSMGVPEQMSKAVFYLRIVQIQYEIKSHITFIKHFNDWNLISIDFHL